MNVAVVCDYLEERWPSMDLVADMLLQHLEGMPGVEATRVCPTMRLRFARIPLAGSSHLARSADRLTNRFFDYPQWLKKNRSFDLFHIVDHSYSQLVHVLPVEKTIVTCHDLDTFRCLLEPSEEPRSRSFRAMAQHILNGLCKAARVTCDSFATRDGLLAHGLVPPERLQVIPLGVHPSCSPEPDPQADLEAGYLLGEPDPQSIDILHVGTTIARKRIDVLLRVFAGIRKQFPRARLIRAGGAFTSDQLELMRQLDLGDCIVQLPFVSRGVLAAIYRRAALVLQPSEREGFGLPVTEAMACGASVIASNLPVLREVGGDAAAYCETGDVPSWVECANSLLCERTEQPDHWGRRVLGNLDQARKFSWVHYTEQMCSVYRQMYV